MATTTNYGWTTPNDSDPFKQGASAIRTLGSAIDTTLGSFLNIKQIVQGSTSTQVASASGTYIDTGLSATITPSSVNSKILVLVTQNGCGKLGSDTTLHLRLNRNSTLFVLFGAPIGWTANTGYNFPGSASFVYYDSPASTSAQTYKTEMAAFSANSSVYTQYNVGAGSPTSTIVLIEVEA
jgi:hypothetical protein